MENKIAPNNVRKIKPLRNYDNESSLGGKLSTEDIGGFVPMGMNNKLR